MSTPLDTLPWQPGLPDAEGEWVLDYHVHGFDGILTARLERLCVHPSDLSGRLHTLYGYPRIPVRCLRLGDIPTVRHPAEIGATVAVVREGGLFLAVPRKTDPGDFGFPGGKIEPGELPHEAVLRELREETGRGGKIVRMLGVWHNVKGLCAAYEVEITGGHAEFRQPGEPIPSWVTASVLEAGTFGAYNHLALAAYRAWKGPL